MRYMKRLLCCSLLICGIWTAAYAQTVPGKDLIVTDKNDSMQVKIVNVTRTEVTYQALVNGQNTTFKAAQDTLTSVFYNYFMHEQERERIIREEKDWAKGYIGLDAGYSYLFKGTQYGSSNPSHNTLSGFGLNVDAGYFVHPRVGLGLRGTWYQYMKGDMNIVYIGPEVNTHFYLKNKKHCLGVGGSLGYAGVYQNNAYLIAKYPNAKIRQHLIGFGINLGYNLAVGDKKSIQFRYAVMFTSSSSPKVTSKVDSDFNNNSQNNQSIASMMLSVGFVFGR